MKKAAVWIAVLSGVITAIDMLAMGIGVYRMDEDLIRITAYIVLPCLAILYITGFVLRFSSSTAAGMFQTMQPTALTAEKESNRRISLWEKSCSFLF